MADPTEEADLDPSVNIGTVRINHMVLGKQLLPQYRREGTFMTMRTMRND